MSERLLKNGNRKVTLTLKPGESAVVVGKNQHVKLIRDHSYYRLGGQVDEVFHSDVLAVAREVYWCHFQQEWKNV